MATVIQELIYKIKADDAQFVQSFKKQQKTLDAVGKKFEAAGKKLSLAITAPIAGISALSVKAFATQEKAELQLRAALQANGRQVKTLFSDYKEFASELQKVTTVGDETTLAMLQQAESLNLTGENAKTAVKNAIGLSKAFGINEKSALRYAAALEDGDTTMLNRYFPALRQIEDQSERVARATELLGNTFQVALAEAETTGGQLTQFKNEIGDLAEEFGRELAPVLINVVKELRPFVERFKELSPEAKKLIVTFAGIAASIGPILLVVGKLIPLFGTLKTVLAFLGTGGVTNIAAFAAAWGPLIVVIGAAAVAIGLVVKEVSALNAITEKLKNSEENFGAVLTEEEKKVQNLVIRLNDLKRQKKDLEERTKAGELILDSEKEKYGELIKKIFITNDLIAKSAFGKKKIAELTAAENKKLEQLTETVNKKIEADQRRLIENLKLEASIAKTNGEIETFSRLQKQAIDIEERLNVALGKESSVVGDVRKARNEAKIATAALNKEVEELNDNADESVAIFENLENTLSDVAAKENVLGDEFDGDAAKVDAYKNALIELQKAGFSATSDEVQELIIKMEELAETTEKTSDKQKAQIEGVAKKIGQSFSQAADALQDIGNLVGLKFDAIAQSIDNQIEEVNLRLEEQKLAIDEELNAELERLGLAKETSDEVFASERERLDELLAETGLTFEQLRGLDEKRLEETLNRVLGEGDAEKAKTQLEKTEAAQRVVIEKKYLAEKKEAEDQAAKELSVLKYQADLNEWKGNLTQSIINTIASSLAAFASAMSLPFPANFIVGAISATTATTFGAIQTGLIRKNKPKPPQFAVGSFDVPSDTQAMVHEGEIITPKTFAESIREGKAVLASPEAMSPQNMAVNQRPIQVNLLLNDEVLASQLFDWSKNGQLKISQLGVVPA